MDYQTDCIIETIGVRRRKEEGARLHLHLSFPVRGNGPLALSAMEQLGNVIRTGFEIMQAPLLARVEAPMDPNEAEAIAEEEPDLGETVPPHDWEAEDVHDSSDASAACRICGVDQEDHPSKAAMELIAQTLEQEAPEEREEAMASLANRSRQNRR